MKHRPSRDYLHAMPKRARKRKASFAMNSPKSPSALHGKRRRGLTKPQILVRGYDEPKTPYQHLRERPTLVPLFKKPSRVAYGY